MELYLCNLFTLFLKVLCLVYKKVFKRFCGFYPSHLKNWMKLALNFFAFPLTVLV